MTPAAFWFLRHGETDWNARNVAQGNLEIPLNATGIAQARAAGERLRGRGIAAIVSSPMQRARVTAEIVGEALALPVAFDPDLHETAYGEREGQPMSEWFTDWIAGRSTPAGAEAFADLRVRAAGAVNRALTHPPPVLVIAHGGLFRALRAEMGLEPNVRAPNGVPVLCQPPAAPGAPWVLVPAAHPEGF